MLALTRTPGLSFMIGEDIEIKILEVRGGRVRVGIVAPRSIPVHRREVFDAIAQDRRRQTGPDLFDDLERPLEATPDQAGRRFAAAGEATDRMEKLIEAPAPPEPR